MSPFVYHEVHSVTRLCCGWSCICEWRYEIAARRNLVQDCMHMCTVHGMCIDAQCDAQMLSGVRASHCLSGICRALKDSLTDNEGKGFIKVVVDAKTDKVLGIHLVGPEVAEILQVTYLSPACYCACCAHACASYHASLPACYLTCLLPYLLVTLPACYHACYADACA